MVADRDRRDHAVVIGGSIAGLAAARVLADHFDTVTIVDRDESPVGGGPRKGVPQGRHAHALLAGGARAIGALYPGIMDQLEADGAAIIDFNEGRWFQAGGYRAASLVERRVASASRPFIEDHVRQRTAALPNVRIQYGATIEGLDAANGRVRGIRLRAADAPVSMRADLVVDCSGRSSGASRWLEQLGYDAPETVEVRCDVRYGTMVLPRTPSDIDVTFAVCIESPPDGKHAAFMLPIEHDRWIVTIAASFGADAPVDEDSFREIAGTLPSPDVAQVVQRKSPLGPVVTHRLASSKRRRYEHLKRVPAGFLALGDAICSFNPIYGQGMSSGVLQAVELGHCLAEHDNDDRLVRAFYKRAAKVIANPWKIAVGADFAYPEATGPKPPGTDLVNRYMRRVLLAAQVSPEVNTEMILVQNLLAPPATLMRPSMVRMVWRAAREAERRQRDDTRLSLASRDEAAVGAA